MASEPKFDPLKDFATVHPAERGAVYMQGPHYFDGDGKYRFSVDSPPAEENADGTRAASGLQLPTTNNPDEGRDYSNRRPLHDPNPPPPMTEADRAAEIKKRYLAELQANGVQVDDDGLPGKPGTSQSEKADAKVTTRTAEEADQADASADKSTSTSSKAAADQSASEASTETPANRWEGVNAKKALKSWLQGELTDPAPPFTEVRKWGTEVFSQTFRSKEDLITHAVENNYVPAEKVKV